MCVLTAKLNIFSHIINIMDKKTATGHLVSVAIDYEIDCGFGYFCSTPARNVRSMMGVV